jgi:hypothetical protein
MSRVHSTQYGSIMNEIEMRNINEIVANFMRDAEHDFIGLSVIAPAVRRDLGLPSNNGVKAPTLDVVRVLVNQGLLAEDFDYANSKNLFLE